MNFAVSSLGQGLQVFAWFAFAAAGWVFGGWVMSSVIAIVARAISGLVTTEQPRQPPR